MCARDGGLAASAGRRSCPAQGDTGAAIRFEHRFRIGAVGFVATDVGPHILDGEQSHDEAVCLTAPAPIVRGAARLHHHRRPRREALEKRFELSSREPLPVDDPVRAIRQATSNTSFARSTATVVASMSASSWWGCEPRFTAMMPRRNREESVPSLHYDGGRGRIGAIRDNR